MDWFYDLTHSPHVDVALLVDQTGRLVATSNRIGSEARRVASMIRAAEVLARGLADALGRGEMHLLQLTTQDGHILVIPCGAAYYLILLTGVNAPLEAITTTIQQTLRNIPESTITNALNQLQSPQSLPERSQRKSSPFDEFDVQDLIESVSNWLAAGGDRQNRGNRREPRDPNDLAGV